MNVSVKYDIDYLGFYAIKAEAQCFIDDSNGYQSWVVGFTAISLCAGDFEMPLRIQDVPDFLILNLTEKAREAADKNFHEVIQ